MHRQTVFVYVSLLTALLVSTPPLRVAYAYPLECTGINQVMNPSLGECSECPANSNVSSDGLCTCLEGFASVVYADSTSVCVDCLARGQVVSNMLSSPNSSQYCITCGGDGRFAFLVDAVLDGGGGRCVCPEGTTLVERMGATLLSGQMCAPCEGGRCTPSCTYPYTNAATASGGSCVCGEGFSAAFDGACVSSQHYDAMEAAAQGKSLSIPLENTDNSGSRGKTVPVEVAEDDLVAAAAQCEAGDMDACNYLANMCVLMQYNQKSTPCALYLELVKRDGCGDQWCERPANLPWLYYIRSSVDILTDTPLPDVPSRHQLTFVVSAYELSGVWKGYRILLDQVNLCRLPNTRMEDFFRAGDTRSISCKLDWRWYIQAEPSTFYELFMINPGNSSELVPIPVIIDYSNHQLNPDGIQDPWLNRPAGTSSSEPAANGYRRRFYAYDNVGGASAHRKAAVTTPTPSYVTAMWSSSIIVSMRNTERSPLMLPLAVYQYASHTVTREEMSEASAWQLAIEQRPVLPSGAKTGLSASVKIFFLTGKKGMNNGLMIALIVLTVVSFVTAWIRTYGWMRRRQNLVLDLAALVRLFVYLCNHVSNFYTLAVAVASWYAFISYKSQHWLEFSLVGDEQFMNVMLYVAVATKGVHVLYSLVEQCNADYFVIDWERSKGQLLRENKVVPVSMWRSTFLANELNELQTIRYWRPLLTMSIILLFLVGAGYENMTDTIPNASLQWEPTAGTFTTLRIAAATFFWFAVAFVMYLLEYQIYYRFIVVHPLQSFVDLCSVSNISVIVLLEPQFGFYIHGESIHAHADVSMQEFQNNLFLESQGNLPVRGLGGQSKCQTFEVYLGPYTRQYLYICYTEMLLEHQRTLGKKALKPANPSKWHYADLLTGFARKPRVYSQAALAIKDRINHAFQESVRRAEGTLLMKFVLQKWFDFPPNVMYMNGPQSGEKGGRDLFFFDDIASYGRAFMCGLDFDLFMLYTVLFTAIDSSLHNVFAAMVITYAVEIVLSWYRSREGLSNITQKTLIDDRFFI